MFGEETLVRGIWKEDVFHAFDEQTLDCLTLSDEYAVCTYGGDPPERTWFVGRLSFEGT